MKGLIMGWTDERVELLKKLWADGLSASQIAAEMGGITRNAVISKVHRLGLSGRAKSPSSASPRPRKARSSGHLLRTPRPSLRSDAETANGHDVEPEPESEPESESELIEIPVEQRKTLLQLDEKTCRWPVGDPGDGDFFFCGGETARDLPYCVHHARVAYEAARDRRRDRRHPFRDGARFNT
jgi:GcrA cell cycle regulator